MPPSDSRQYAEHFKQEVGAGQCRVSARIEGRADLDQVAANEIEAAQASDDFEPLCRGEATNFRCAGSRCECGVEPVDVETEVNGARTNLLTHLRHQGLERTVPARVGGGDVEALFTRPAEVVRAIAGATEANLPDALGIAEGGRGVLLGGVPGTAPARVVVLGGGVVGTNAARMALGLGGDVTIFDVDLRRLAELDERLGRGLRTLYSTEGDLAEHVAAADLVIGAVLVPGSEAPRLVSETMVKGMHRGSVVVDVAIDQGGCIETSRPTTHSTPTVVEHGVVHYCVANMPGAVARTSTFALNHATLPFTLAVATHGPEAALAADPHLLAGLNVHTGHVTHPAVADAVGLPYRPSIDALRAGPS